jgi:diadenosine tetraphosphatase ApaH/serine/threonine PP2A family protein phosphatase
MRYLVLSDIHGNLEALEAALAASPVCDRVLVLGDLVGYGADPNAVIERICALPVSTSIRGNHDKVACGIDTADDFNPLARRAITWTADVLTPEHRAWLHALPKGPVTVDGDVEICHGSPYDEDEYVFNELQATHAMRLASRRICLFGHTHVPMTFETTGSAPPGPPRLGRSATDLQAGSRYFVNCGAVGQPRDGDPLAAYGVLDVTASRLEIRSTPYDVGRTRAKILAAGLPQSLADRLVLGR